MTDMNAEVGARISRLLRGNGKNQNDLAKLLNCTPSTISRKIAVKDSSFSLDELAQIVKLLGVSWEMLMTGQEKVTETEYSSGALRIASIYDRVSLDHQKILSNLASDLLLIQP